MCSFSPSTNDTLTTEQGPVYFDGALFLCLGAIGGSSRLRRLEGRQRFGVSVFRLGLLRLATLRAQSGQLLKPPGQVPVAVAQKLHGGGQ